eukprot:c5544_g1_i1.p1 GENE.c5544_g1_i1~~c5544_g1_i1.p1  ORF type:complete len:307 (+),score=44.98 c5544_g1_i1:58-978(+)
MSSPDHAPVQVVDDSGCARDPSPPDATKFKKLVIDEYPVFNCVEIHDQLHELKASVFFLECEGTDANTVQKGLKSDMFQEWREAISQNDRMVVTAVIFQCIIFDEADKIKFLKIDSKCYNVADYVAWLQGTVPKIGAIPGISFMKGPTISVLIIIPEDEDYTILAVHPRVAVAELRVPEIPSGHFSPSGEFSGPVAQLIDKTLQFKIDMKNLVDLTQLAFGDSFRGVYPSAGGCDEYVRLFLYRHEGATKEQLKIWKQKCTGKMDDSNPLALKLCLLSDLWKESPDAKSLTALGIFTRLKSCGMLA